MSKEREYTVMTNAFHKRLVKERPELWWKLRMATIRKLASAVARREGFRVSVNSADVPNSYCVGYEIKLRTDQRCKAVLIHELAHCIVKRGFFHGPTFQRVFRRLLREYT